MSIEDRNVALKRVEWLVKNTDVSTLDGNYLTAFNEMRDWYNSGVHTEMEKHFAIASLLLAFKVPDPCRGLSKYYEHVDPPLFTTYPPIYELEKTNPERILLERDLLAGAIVKMGVDIGLISPTAVITGPHLIQICEDITRVHIANEASREHE